MIECFDLPQGTDAATLYQKYMEYTKLIRGLAVSDDFRQTFLSIVNTAYDDSLGLTKEAMEAALSPRPSE